MPLSKEVGLGPGHIVLDGDPVGTQPPTASPLHFWPMPVVAKRSPISATAELLLCLVSSSSSSFNLLKEDNIRADYSKENVDSKTYQAYYSTYGSLFKKAFTRLLHRHQNYTWTSKTPNI